MSDYDKNPSAEASGAFPTAGEPLRVGKLNPRSQFKTRRLIGAVPGLVTNLVKSELDQVKLEMRSKAVKGGSSLGLFAGVAFFGITLWAVLITAAILGLNTVFAPWLSALIVAGVLLVLMIIAGIVAVVLFKKMNGVAPSETLASVREDLNALKGLGKYE